MNSKSTIQVVLMLGLDVSSWDFFCVLWTFLLYGQNLSRSRFNAPKEDINW
jgi:hypothetical protein